VASDWPPALGGYADGASDNECEDWTSEGDDAYFLIGDPMAGTGAWNGGWSGTQCSTAFRLYCLQRDYSNVLTFEATGGRLAFITNQPWIPAGGLAAADARCNQDALDAGLAGSFKALRRVALFFHRLALGAPRRHPDRGRRRRLVRRRRHAARAAPDHGVRNVPR
jgi:hypothetical protein